MERPTKFEDHQYLGDKRAQVVYDFDVIQGDELEAVIAELIASEQFATFGPDTLAEAQNRGYHPHWTIRESARARAADSD